MKLLVTFFCICAVALGNVIPKLDGRIVGGVETTIEEHPYQIDLRYGTIHWCGGSILNEYTILTASHCVHDRDYDQFSLRVGSTDNNLGESFEIASITEHEDYNKEASFDNDVCIIKLTRPLTYSSKVQPISLESNEVPVGTEAVVTGWGATYEGDPITPDNLREVGVNLISSSDCKEVYGNSVTSTMLCAQTPNKDSCQGDSGGPLVANGKLVGVVSWGIGCARPQYPGIYAKVSVLRDWIVAHL